jgi:hypothetical protein
MSTVAFAWIHDSPETALGAIQSATQRDDPVRVQVVSNAVKQWSHLDAEGAGLWLAEQPPGRERDESAVIYADTLSLTNPEQAARWAGSIQDPALRSAALMQVMRQWIQKAPEVCLRWCENRESLLGESFLAEVRTIVTNR